MNANPSGLSIMLWSCDLKNPERAATPFIVAQAATALDLKVEMLFTAQTVQWLLLEHQTDLIGFGPERQTVQHYLQAVAGMGVEIRACSQAAHALGIEKISLVPQCLGFGGIVSFVEREQSPDWRTMIF